jgi:hypothetical protein
MVFLRNRNGGMDIFFKCRQIFDLSALLSQNEKGVRIQKGEAE